MRLFVSLFIVGLAVTSQSAFAQTKAQPAAAKPAAQPAPQAAPQANVKWNLDKAHSEIAFNVKHLGITNVRGKFNEFDAQIQAITTDIFPLSMRGRVMGFIQTAFAASQVLGIPFGLYIATHLGWHWAFYMIVVVGVLAGMVILLRMQPIVEHLKMQHTHSPFVHLVKTVSNPRYLQAFAAVAFLATGGFMLMPFGSAFSVHNLGIDLEHLPMVYMITGAFSIITGPLVGRLSDKFGKYKAFMAGSLGTMVMIAIYTRLGITPIAGVIAVSVLMFVGISARMISSQALMSAIPDPSSRGAFMAVNSSVQQISGGMASVLAGLIVVEGPGGVLQRFDMLGNVVLGAIVITMFLMHRIHRLVPEVSDVRKPI